MDLFRYLDNLSKISKKMVKLRKNSKVFAKFEDDMVKRHRIFINESTRNENSWLFNRNSRLEIQKLIFLQTEEITSPRLHNNMQFYDLLSLRIEVLIQRHIYWNQKEVDEETSVNQSLIRKMRVSRKKSTVLPRDEEGSVPLSRTVNVINYQSNINLKKYLK